MRILAVDTTTSVNTVAICDNEVLLAETVVECRRAHAERLLATIDWVLNEAGAALDGLDALAVSNGPGSFTGLRIGVATMKGLALANELPLIAVPTLDAMTRLTSVRNGLVCPLLDARMGEVFGAVYRFDKGERSKLTEDRVCPIEDILEMADGSTLFLGDGVNAYEERLKARIPDAHIASPANAMPRASTVCLEALGLLKQGIGTDAALVNPVYLRKSQAEENLEKKRG